MTKPKLLTRDEILGAADRATEVVDVPEWGGAVTVRALSGKERDQYEASMMKYQALPNGQVKIQAVDTDNIRARLASLTIVDEEGQRMFREADLLALGDKSAAALNRVFTAAQHLSRLSNQDIEALKTGLKADQSASSGSDSLETSA